MPCILARGLRSSGSLTTLASIHDGMGRFELQTATDRSYDSISALPTGSAPRASGRYLNQSYRVSLHHQALIVKKEGRPPERHRPSEFGGSYPGEAWSGLTRT